jgi:hypothetical protein
MKLIKRQELMSSDNGTLFAFSFKGEVSELAVKVETITKENGKNVDFKYMPVTPILGDTLSDGIEIEGCHRDGCFDDDDEYILYSPTDKDNVVNVLTRVF